MTLQELELNIRQSVNELREANTLHRAAAREWAVKMNRYRRAKATAFVKLCGDEPSRKKTNPEKEAIVDLSTESEWLEAHLAEGEMMAMKELVISLQKTLSAWQTLASNTRTEIDLTRQPYENRPVARRNP
jgi:hypothetical protein